MPDYEILGQILSTFTEKSELEALGLALYSGDQRTLAAIPKLASFFNNHEVTCLSNGNSRIFKIKNQTAEQYILKLEAWTMSEEVEMCIKTNPALSVFIAPVYFQKAFSDIEKAQEVKNTPGTKMGRFTMISPSEPPTSDAFFHPVIRKSRIQIQPFCQGGTLESAGKKAMSDASRIENALHLYQQVAIFYKELEKPPNPILFPDGKPSNFTLNEHNGLAMTDLKTYTLANETSLRDNSIINLELSPLYIPIPPPRQLSKVYSRHLGLNLYCYLTGSSYTTLFDSMHGKELQKRLSVGSLVLNFTAPIFTTENGKLLAALIKSMVDDDQTKRPDCENVQKALQAIACMNEIESLLQANPDAALRQGMNDFRMQFIANIQDPMKFQTLVSDLEYRLQNDATIRKINDQLSKLESDLSKKPDQILNQIGLDVKQQLSTCMQNRSQLGPLETKLECCALLIHLKSINSHETTADIHRYIIDTQAAIESLHDQQALKEVKADLEYRITINQDMHQVNNYLIQLHGILQHNPTEQVTALISDSKNQLRTLTTNRQPLSALLSTLKQGIERYTPKEYKEATAYGRFFKAGVAAVDQKAEKTHEAEPEESAKVEDQTTKGVK